MDRRNAIMAFSGILASSALSAMPRRAVFAQPPAESGQATRITPLQYKTQTLQVGTFSKETSQLAVAQAIHPRVKQFAQFEVNEQTAMAQVLTDVNNPPPVPLDAQHAALLQQLQSQSGKGFDIAYIQGQIVGHQQLLNIQQAFLNSILTGNDDEHIAVLARVVIQMHLTMLQDLQAEITA
jgi:putative membrane protein